MNHYPTKGIFLIFITFIILAYPVGAALNTIAAGDTVFIGEQGLDISSQIPAVTAIGWWSPGSTVASSEPDYKVGITDPKNVYISPTEFSSRKGTWYSYPGRALVFNVADPYIDIKIEDRTVNVDVTGKWAPLKDELGFRIETNLNSMVQRVGGGAGAPVNIRVQTPEGSVLSSLIDSTGAAHSLDIGVTTSPFITVNFWDTGNSLYNSGTYVIWVECNENQMKDNYNQPGKTVSVPKSLLVQEQNPLISVIVQATTTATKITTRQTTKPTTAVTTELPTTVPTVTTAIPLLTISQETPEQTVTPSPTPTKAPLFGGCTILAGMISCALYALRRR